MMDRKKIVLIITILFLSVSFYSPALAADARLLFSPDSGTFPVGDTFSVRVIVDSGGGVGINAADGVISFETEYLSVTGLSKNNSVFSLWTQDPTFSNSNGEISFGGGNPQAFTGTFGTIFTITFQAKKEGTTQVNFSSGSVLAADGQGTNVLSAMEDANFTLEVSTPPGGEQEEEEEEPPSGLLPPAPEVSSPTHPEADTWYSNNSPVFEWDLPADVVAVSLLLHENALATPDYYSEGLIEETQYDQEPVEDGTWYFHIKFKNNHGWGPTAHRKVLIDATPPDPFELQVEHSDPTDPRPVLVFETADELSGIDRFEIKIGEDDWAPIPPEEIQENRYQMPAQSPGAKQIQLKAVDKAGNESSASANIEVEPLRPPTITELSDEVTQGDVFIAKGISFYPGATVEITIAQGEEIIKKENTMADKEGSWLYFSQEEIESGEYEIWAKLTDDRGAQSNTSERKAFTVVPPSIIASFGWIIILVLVLILLALLVALFYIQQRCEERIHKIRKETKEVRLTSARVFSALREELEEQVQMLDKKPSLSESEKGVRDKLKEALDISEEFLGKEIKDIEEQIQEEE
ncbi:MAG: hypothetical protein GF370_05075 [Candidatus Nealsonbacteria bacterium]|nr:hypothetical protein [Candidatus Nealsonbacteria bacterium]